MLAATRRLDFNWDSQASDEAEKRRRYLAEEASLSQRRK
jgi:hypothetical protein